MKKETKVYTVLTHEEALRKRKEKWIEQLQSSFSYQFHLQLRKRKEKWIEQLTKAYMTYDGMSLSDKDCKELANLLRCKDEKRN